MPYNDVRFAARQFLKNPGFTAAAVLTLALGIGATTSVFSVIHSALLRPLPYPDPGQLVQVTKELPPNSQEPIIGGGDYVGGHELDAWREQSQSLRNIAAYSRGSVNLTGAGPAERLLAGEVTADFFPMLGVKPAIGRLFLTEDESPRGPRVALLSHEFWRRRYNQDPGVIGRNIRLDQESHEIVGVLPAGFQFSEPCDIWKPMRLGPMVAGGAISIHLVRAVARIKPGVPLDQAEAELNSIAQRANPFLPTGSIRRSPPPPGAGPMMRPLTKALPPGGPGPLPSRETGNLSSDNVIQSQPLPNGLPPEVAGGPDAFPFEESLAPIRIGGSARIKLTRLHEHWVQGLRSSLLILFGAVALVLAISCVNVANLLLARSSARRKEISVRSALGARPYRLVSQLLTESVLLALLGGAVGLVLAYGSLGVFNGIEMFKAPHMALVELDYSVLGFSAVVSLLTGLLFGIAPALQALRIDINEGLKDSSAGPREGLHRFSFSSGLIVAETALALVLLVSAGLLLKSFVRLRSVEPGFRTAGVLTFQFNLEERRFALPAQRMAMAERILEELRALPGVESAALTDHLPLTQYSLMTSVGIEGRAEDPSRKDPPVSVASVSPQYFEVMGIELKQGRTFRPEDRNAGRLMVNESFARQFFPGESAVGKRVRDFERHSGETGWLTIVGVMADARDEGLDKPATPEIYRLEAGRHGGYYSAVLKAAGDLNPLAQSIRSRLQQIDSDLPIHGLMSMQERLDTTTAPRRLLLALLGTFAGLAVFLAAVGIYGVMSFIVAQRTREIGVRMALGAGSKDVVRLVLRQGMSRAGLGLVIGLAIAGGITRYLSSLLFQTGTLDPVTYGGVALLLGLVALAACYGPARRAAKVDPMRALRQE